MSTGAYSRLKPFASVTTPPPIADALAAHAADTTNVHGQPDMLEVFSGTGYPVVSVQAKGAVGDGVTPCRTAFQDAIAAAGPGGTVFIPAGEWLIKQGEAGDLANLLVTELDQQIVGAGERLTTLILDDDWSDVTVPAAGASNALRTWLLRNGTRMTGLTIDGQRDNIDRSVYKGISQLPLRTYTDDGSTAQDVQLRYVTVKNVYVESRRFAVVSIDLAANTLTLSDSAVFTAGDTVKLSGFTGGTLVQGTTSRAFNGTQAVVENADTGPTISLTDVDLTVAPSVLGFVYDADDVALEGFGYQLGGRNNEALYCRAFDCDGSGFSFGGGSDATNFGVNNVVSLTASNERIVTGVVHHLQVGDTATFSGVTGALVSVAGGAAVSVNGLTGVVASVVNDTTVTMLDWNITVDGTGGRFYSPEVEARGAGDCRWVGCIARRCGWQGFTMWRTRNSYGIDCIAEQCDRQGFNMEYCRHSWYIGGRSVNNGSSGVTIHGYTEGGGVRDVHLGGSGLQEIQVRHAGGDVYRGIANGITLSNLTFETVPVRHLTVKTNSLATVGDAVPTGVVDCVGAEDWIVFGSDAFTRLDTTIGKASGTTLALDGFTYRSIPPLTGELEFAPLPMWTSTTAGTTAELSLATGAISTTPATYHVTGNVSAAFALGKLPRARRYLVEVRWQMPSQVVENGWQCRVKQKGVAAADQRAMLIRYRAQDAGKWVTQRMLVTVANSAEDHALEFVRMSGGSGDSDLYVDYVRVWPIERQTWDHIRNLPYRHYIETYEDFTSGTASNGQIGNTNMALNQPTSTTTLTYTTAEGSHAGVLQMATSTTATSVGVINSVNDNQIIDITAAWEWRWWFREGGVYTTSFLRLGIANTAGAATPGDGIYLERSGADTQYQWTFKVGGVDDRHTTGAATTTSWQTAAAWRVSATTIACKLQDQPVQFFSTNAALSSLATIVAALPTANPEVFAAIGNGGSLTGYNVRLDGYYLRQWADR